MSLRRTRADWPIVAAAWLVTLLAAALVAAGPIYWSAASAAGLSRTLAGVSAAETSIEVSLYGAPARVAAMDGQVATDLQHAVATVDGTVLRDVRSTSTLTLASRPSVREGDLAVLGFLDALPDHATLIDGSWPVASDDSSGPIPVVVVDAVAKELRLAVGDQLSLATQVGDQAMVPVRLVGIFAIDAATDRYWHGDTQLTAGILDGPGYRTFGPFLTTSHDLLQRAPIPSVHAWWRTYPDLALLTVDGSTLMLRSLEALPDRLRTDVGEAPTIKTGLPPILADAERSLLVSRTNMYLLMAQLAILAIYAVILIASLLVDHRRPDTAGLLSRGAGPSQVGFLALAEGILIAIPAAVLGPWLAVAAVAILNVVGPLAEVGLDTQPRVTVEGYLAAGAIAIVCVALLVLPSMLSARSLSAEQRGLTRHETRTLGQRMGLDIALLAISCIALWQLRLYGAPLTRTVQGSLGIDPLLVVAPAISLLAGGVLALRILPLLAQGAEAVVSRRRDLVATLGSRQLARRPLRYTRSALLLMIAVSMGVLTVSYAATWSSAQRDQAAYQAGADVRVVPGDSTGGLPAWALPGAYAELPGIERASPVERIPDGFSIAAGSGDLLGIDADTAAGIVLFRADELAGPLSDLWQTLRDGRPDPHFSTMPAGTAYLRIAPRLDAAIRRTVIDPDTGQPHLEQLDPASLADVRVSVSALLRDADGLLYRVESGPVPVAGPGAAVVLPLVPTAGRGAPVVEAGTRLDGPVELAGLGIDVWLPGDAVMTDGFVGVASVAAGGDPGGPWTEVPLTSTGWSAQMAEGHHLLGAVPAGQTDGTAVHLTGSGLQNSDFDNGTGQQAGRFSFLPAALASLDVAVPVIANRAYPRRQRIVTRRHGHGDGGWPSPAPVDRRGGRLVPDDRPGAAVADPRRGHPGPAAPAGDGQRPKRGRVVDEGCRRWVGGVGSGAARRSVRQRTGGERRRPRPWPQHGPGRDRHHRSPGDRLRRDRAVRHRGLTVTAGVSARERRPEFALLRALGLSGGQLSGSLWLENGSLVLVSLLAGTALGLLIGWLVLPFVTVTQGATAPVPPVIVDVPWDRILQLDVAIALALFAALLVIGGVLRRLEMGSVLRMGED